MTHILNAYIETVVRSRKVLYRASYALVLRGGSK
jgi:hypothetical protein